MKFSLLILLLIGLGFLKEKAQKIVGFMYFLMSKDDSNG